MVPHIRHCSVPFMWFKNLRIKSGPFVHINVWQGVWRCTHAKLALLTPHPLAPGSPQRACVVTRGIWSGCYTVRRIKKCCSIYNPFTNRMNGTQNCAGWTVPFEKNVHVKGLLAIIHCIDTYRYFSSLQHKNLSFDSIKLKLLHLMYVLHTTVQCYHFERLLLILG